MSCLGSVTAYENEALLYNQKALAIRKKILGENHPITANSYNDIGMVLLNGFGNFKDALSYYKKALGIFERELGEEHRYTANTYYCFAEAYYLKRDYSMALEYYQKAMHIYEKVLGKEHPDTTKVYLKIAEMNNSLLLYNHIHSSLL